MDFNLPELGEGVYEAEMVRWLVAEGTQVKPGQTMLEVLTDKATMEVPAPFAGTIRALKVKEGDKLKIGQAILSYEPLGAESRQAAETPETTPPAARERIGGAKASAGQPRPIQAEASRGNGPKGGVLVKAAPSVRLMARKLGLDITQVRGSGPQGRVLVEDLAQAARPLAPAPAGPGATPTPVFDLGQPGTKRKLHGLRRVIAEHMVQAKHTIPHYTYVDECEVTELVRLRETLKEPFAAKGARLTYLAFFVKACAQALQEVPVVNASLDEEAGEIVLHDVYNIGVAVATPAGLIVPVVRDALNLSLLDCAREIERLSTEARQGKSRLEDLRGGTFTITSIGNIGGLFATPIINHPQVGIVGIGRIVKRPVFDEHGQVRPADMAYLSFTFDHRVLDGAIGATFGNALIRRLKAPAALLL